MDFKFVIRRSLQITLGLAAAMLLGLAVILFGAPPALAMRWVAEREASWLLNSREGSGQSLVGQWLNKGLSQAIAVRAIDPRLPDAERVGIALATVKPFLISQPEVPHGPTLGPTGAAGMGWCDHVNLFAGEVLANSFGRVETVAVTHMPSRSSHTFGRVWSSELGEWLYFDVWPDEVVVFRATANGARFLFRSTPVQTGSFTPEMMAVTRQIYDLAPQAFTLHRARATLGGLLFERASNKLNHGSARAAGADAAIKREAALIGRTVHRPPPRIGKVASREYLLARVDQAEGRAGSAREHYVAAARLEAKDGPYRRAAATFAARL